MMKMINVKVPTRVDLGGGTLDIWPIYLLHDNCCTVNMAIDLLVEVELIINKGEICKISLNNKRENFYISDLNKLPTNGSFKLINHIINYFQPSYSFELNVKINTPKGSGLGTSSSLAIALCKAFILQDNKDCTDNEILNLAMALETQILQFPTGNQDYLAALMGGINSWHYDVTGWTRKIIFTNENELVKHSLLCYIGKPHNSALSNWMVYKKRFEKNKKIINCLEKIKDASLEIEDALIRRDWMKFAKGINDEWENRKRLSLGIETKEMRKAIKIAFDNGALAAKGCGAARGGTIYFFIDPEADKFIKDALRSEGYQILPFRINKMGLTYLIS